jgi:esterase/lipase
VLFFLGGANQEPEFYYRLYRLLATKYRVVALCYPGIGNNFRFKGKLTTDKYLDYIEKFISNKFAKIELVACGISLGGLLLAKYLDQKRSGRFVGFLGISILTKTYSSSFISLAFRYLVNEKKKYKGIKYKSCTLSLFSWKNFRNLAEKYRHSNFVRKLVLKPEDLQWMNYLPSLIFIGAQDNIIDAQYSWALFNHFSKTKFIAIPDQKHDALLNMGDDILPCIEPFLSKL